MKKSPKKIIKNTAKVAAVLWGLVLWWYQLSEKIGYIHHDVQQELKDNLGKKEIVHDQETNDIIKLMSWKISQNEFDWLLLRHGYMNDTVKIDELIQADEAMYKTILEIQTMYANPKISFSWFFKNLETWENEPNRARFNPFTNTIKSHQLDSVMIKFDNVYNKENFMVEHTNGLSWLWVDTWQKYLLNNRIAEIAHAKQLQERWLIKMAIDGTIDYITSWFDYGKTYEVDGTEEYEAHKIYEPQLIKQFIEIYEKYADKESDVCLWNLSKFNSWFFDTFQDEEKALTYMNILEQQWNPQANYILARSYFDIYTKNFISAWWHSISTNDTITKTIFGKEYTADTFFNEVIDHYKKAYYLWNVDAGFNLVQTVFHYTRWKHNDIILEIGNDLLTHHKDDLEKQQLVNICSKIWSIYYQQKDMENWSKYMKMSDEFSTWEDIRRY